MDICVIEKIPVFDGNKTLSGGSLSRQLVGFWVWKKFHDEESLGIFAQQLDVSLKNKVVYYPLVASCRGRRMFLLEENQNMLNSWHGVATTEQLVRLQGFSDTGDSPSRAQWRECAEKQAVVSQPMSKT